MRYFIADTETTGLGNPSAPVEVAFIEVDEGLRILGARSSLIDPQMAIEPGASNIHGLYADDVVGQPLLEDWMLANWPQENAVTVIGHNCLSGDHEILTESGWLRLDKCPPKVEAFTWSNGTVQLEPCLLVEKDYQGKMFEYATTYHKGRYTEDHRVYHTRTRHLLAGGAPVWEVCSASEYAKMGPNSAALPSCGLYDNIPKLDLSELHSRILEMIRADANLTANSCRFSFKRERKIARCQALLDSAGVPYSKGLRPDGVTRISVLRHPLLAVVRGLLGVGKFKRLGSWVLDLSLASRKALLDEAGHWDGCIAEGVNRQFTVSSQHSSEIDWLQAAAVLSGCSSKSYKDRPNTRGWSRADSKLSTVTIRRRSHLKTLQPPTELEYSGKVYCLSTQAGAFLTRRGGAAWITGNCSYDMRYLSKHIPVLGGQLCTLALARRFITGSANHKLGTLAQHLTLPTGTAHRAAGDVETTLHLLKVLLVASGRSLPEAVEAEAKPGILQIMPFGKFKGLPVTQVPRGYWLWLSDRPDLPPALRLTVDRFKNV